MCQLFPRPILIHAGAVNPRDSDLKISSDGDHIVFNGFKNFNTGGVVSDLTVLEGALDGSEAHIFAVAPTQQSGIQFAVRLLLSPLLSTELTHHSTTGTTSVSDSPNPVASKSMPSPFHGKMP